MFSLSLNSNGGDVDLRQHFQRVDMKKKKKDARPSNSSEGSTTTTTNFVFRFFFLVVNLRHVKSEKCEWKRRRKDERASIINDNGRLKRRRLRRCRE